MLNSPSKYVTMWIAGLACLCSVLTVRVAWAEATGPEDAKAVILELRNGVVVNMFGRFAVSPNPCKHKQLSAERPIAAIAAPASVAITCGAAQPSANQDCSSAECSANKRPGPTTLSCSQYCTFGECKVTTNKNCCALCRWGPGDPYCNGCDVGVGCKVNP